VSGRPFARIYYVDLERDYPDVWRDDAALATYVRLLSIADAMWPAIPEVPRSAKAVVVKQLIDAVSRSSASPGDGGLVIAVPPYSYRIRGLDAERTARSNAAGIASRIRWGTPASTPDGNAPANPAGIPTHATSPDQSRPVQPRAQSAPKKNGRIVDEQNWTEEQRKAVYIEGMARRTGVKP
jgi:hypothetical protein